MKTVVIDPGHGGRDQGNTSQGYQEKTFNLALCLNVRRKLLERYRVKVLMTRTKDTFINLGDRTRFANRQHADYFCSLHHISGHHAQFVSYIDSGHVPLHTKKAQARIHFAVLQKLSAFDIADGGKRRIKSDLLHRAQMPAILLEMHVMPFKKELSLVKSSGFLETAASAIADGLAEALHLPAVEKPLYRVIAGSFKDKNKALDRVAFLEQQQIPAFVDHTLLSGETYYRVQAGSYRLNKDAEKRLAELKRMGLGEPFIAVGSEPAEYEPDRTAILGDLHLSTHDMDAYALYVNPDAPRLGKYYSEFGHHYGVRGDIAFAQALYETNDFRFTAIANPEEHNYGGIAIAEQSDSNFPTPQSGVLAHIQHLYAHASAEPLPEGYPLVDPSFKQVKRGSASTWISLKRNAAHPEPDYGQSILRKFEQMADYTKKQAPSTFSLRGFLQKIRTKIKQMVCGKRS